MNQIKLIVDDGLFTKMAIEKISYGKKTWSEYFEWLFYRRRKK